MLREEAYLIVQKNAHEAFDEKVLFDEKIKSEPQIQEIFTQSELDKLFSFEQYSVHADTIFDRVYG